MEPGLDLRRRFLNETADFVLFVFMLSLCRDPCVSLPGGEGAGGEGGDFGVGRAVL